MTFRVFILPAVMIVGGLVHSTRERPQGDMDFFRGLLGALVALGGLVLLVGIVLGRFVR